MSADARAALAADAVEVWTADLAARDRQDVLVALLSPEERERAARFVKRQDGERWARAHGILRSLLGRYVGIDPAALRLAIGEHGKPALADEAGGGAATASGDGALPDVRFNLSHSGDLALYAFALGREVGVDVEAARRPLGDVVKLAARMLGDEVAERLGALDTVAREAEFLRLWTRHEAATKCRGTGIGAAAVTESATGERPLWVVELDAGPDATAALAVEGPACELRRRRWG